MMVTFPQSIKVLSHTFQTRRDINYLPNSRITFTITIIKHLIFNTQKRCKDWFDVLNTKVTQKSRKSTCFAFTTPRLPRAVMQNMVVFGIEITFGKRRGLVLLCFRIHKNNFTWCILVGGNKKAARLTADCLLRLTGTICFICYKNQNTVFGYKKGLKMTMKIVRKPSA